MEEKKENEIKNRRTEKNLPSNRVLGKKEGSNERFGVWTGKK